MAAYPALPVIADGSLQEPVDDLVVDEWPNGGVRGRSYFAGNLWKWTLVHKTPNDSDRATHLAFYQANKLLNTTSFVSPWDGSTYNNICFTEVPTYEFTKDRLWVITAKMRQAF